MKSCRKGDDLIATTYVLVAIVQQNTVRTAPLIRRPIKMASRESISRNRII
jgi:hypothetical protein